MSRTARRVCLALGALMAPAVAAAEIGAHEVIEIGAFSRAAPGAAPPPGWTPLYFRKIARHTRYRLVRDEDGAVVVRADSRAAASGLVRRLDVDPSVYPILRWRWKVQNLIAGADIGRRSGDDYPARVYVTFAPRGAWERARLRLLRFLYGEPVPGSAISYVWASRAPQGTVVPNAYTDRVMMIVVRSGPARLGQWVEEVRDIEADYRAAFGRGPPPIAGVAVMTDTDDTAGEATAFYGDLRLERRR